MFPQILKRTEYLCTGSDFTYKTVPSTSQFIEFLVNLFKVVKLLESKGLSNFIYG